MLGNAFPPKLIEPCILAGCPRGGAVLDPFGGAGTTGIVAEQHGRRAVLIELNPDYVELAHAQEKDVGGLRAASWLAPPHHLGAA